MMPPTIKVSMADLQERAKMRPAGYIEDVLGQAVEVNETHYTITLDDLDRLRRKYTLKIEPMTPARRLQDFIKGAIGLTKANLGIGLATAETAEARKNLCLACKHHDFGMCRGGGCGCYLAAKVVLKSERCPIGKWGPGASSKGADTMRHQAFTLLEMVVVLAIVAMLIGMGAWAVTGLTSTDSLASTQNSLAAVIEAARNRAMSRGRDAAAAVIPNYAGRPSASVVLLVRQAPQKRTTPEILFLDEAHHRAIALPADVQIAGAGQFDGWLKPPFAFWFTPDGSLYTGNNYAVGVGAVSDRNPSSWVIEPVHAIRLVGPGGRIEPIALNRHTGRVLR